MPFDPTKPATNSEILSAELRSQFNGLKYLIDQKIPVAEVGIPNGVASLDADGALEQPANWDTLVNKPVPVADGTYTVELGTATNGTITVVDGIVTAVQEATNLPPTALVASGFGDADTNGDYYRIADINGQHAYEHVNHTRWIFYGSDYDTTRLADSPDPALTADLYYQMGWQPFTSSWWVSSGAAPAGSTTSA